MSRGPLTQALRDEYERHRVRQAKLIRDWPAAAEMHVRLALLESGERISEQARYRIYTILSFALPDVAGWVEEASPNERLNEQARWELAYQQQLERRSCPECGAGLCVAGK